MFLTDSCIAFFQFFQLFIGKIFNIDHVIVRRAVGANEFVELKVKSLGVSVLSVLNQEDHKKSDDRGASIDDELPGVGEVEYGPAGCPYNQRNHGTQKHHRMSNQSRNTGSKTAEPEIQGV